MNIWVDADSCLKAIKNILFRAAQRVKISTVFVANRPLKIPRSSYLKSVLVSGGMDVADVFIIEQAKAGELIITDDIIFASKVIGKGAVVLNTRGKLLTKSNIGQSLTLRNFKEELRHSGVDAGGPSSPNLRDRQNFANQLDWFLTEYLKKINNPD